MEMVNKIVNKVIKPYKTWILLIIVLLLTAFAVSKYFESNQYEKQLAEYKDLIIEKDSLRQVEKGSYQKLVDDTEKNSKNILNGLKAKNKKLAQRIEDQDKKILLYMNTIASFESKTDTVFVESDQSFVDFYPNRDDWFIKYTSVFIDTNKRLGDWKFSDYSLDVVVTEKTKGLFEIDFEGPDFLKVKSLEVRSLPLSPIAVDNFGWLLGGDMSYNFGTHLPALGVYGGFRYKKSNFFIKADTQKTVGAGFLKEF